MSCQTESLPSSLTRNPIALKSFSAHLRAFSLSASALDGRCRQIQAADSERTILFGVRRNPGRLMFPGALRSMPGLDCPQVRHSLFGSGSRVFKGREAGCFLYAVVRDTMIYVSTMVRSFIFRLDRIALSFLLSLSLRAGTFGEGDRRKRAGRQGRQNHSEWVKPCECNFDSQRRCRAIHVPFSASRHI